MSIGNTYGYLDVQGVQHSLVPPRMAPDAYILSRVHLLGCSIVFKPVFNQTFHSLFPCDLFVVRKRTSKTTQTTGDNKAAVVTSKPRQTVDEIHVQHRVSTVGIGRLEISPGSRESLCLLALQPQESTMDCIRDRSSVRVSRQ